MSPNGGRSAAAEEEAVAAPHQAERLIDQAARAATLGRILPSDGPQPPHAWIDQVDRHILQGGMVEMRVEDIEQESQTPALERRGA